MCVPMQDEAMRLNTALRGLLGTLQEAAAGLPIHLLQQQQQQMEEEVVPAAGLKFSDVPAVIAALQQAQQQAELLQAACIGAVMSESASAVGLVTERKRSKLLQLRAEFAEAQLAALQGAAQQPGPQAAAGASVGVLPAAAATATGPEAVLPLPALEEGEQGAQVRAPWTAATERHDSARGWHRGMSRHKCPTQSATAIDS